MCPGIAADESVTAGQHRLRVGAAEGDGSSIGHGRVAKGVLSRDLYGLRDAGGCGQRKTVDHQLARGRSVHGDALASFEAASHCVGRGNRLRSGRFQGGAERVQVISERARPEFDLGQRERSVDRLGVPADVNRDVAHRETRGKGGGVRVHNGFKSEMPADVTRVANPIIAGLHRRVGGAAQINVRAPP